MTSFLRQNSTFVGVLGTGLCIGVGGTILYLKLTSRLLRELTVLSTTVTRELTALSTSVAVLSSSVAELKAEVQSLKDKVAARKKRSAGFYSVHASSGDDDDDFFEEAYGGGLSPPTSDFESVRSVPIESDGQEPLSDQEVEITPEGLFSQVDKLFDGTDSDKLKALSVLSLHKDKFSNDVEFCWRLTKSTYQVSKIEGSTGNNERKKELTYEAKNLAEKAVQLDDTCANAHKWFAITLGSIGDYESTQDRIKNGYVFKEHIEKAIELSPDDASNHHLLGRWCYGVYMLSWLERKAAATLYATPPTSTADEALKHFLQADQLNPGKWKENSLYIGKCYIELSKYPDAVEWLDKAKQVPVVSQDDKTAEDEINSLLAKYKR